MSQNTKSVDTYSDPTIPFAYSCVCWIYIYIIDKISIGNIGKMQYLGFIVFGKGWLYSSCHTAIWKWFLYKMVCMEKIINDIITLFMFNILKLLCSYFSYIYLIFLHHRLYWINLWVTFESICIWIYVRFDLTFFFFSSYLCFILLYFICYVKYWSKVAVELEFWNITNVVF